MSNSTQFNQRLIEELKQSNADLAIYAKQLEKEKADLKAKVKMLENYQSVLSEEVKRLEQYQPKQPVKKRTERIRKKRVRELESWQL